MKATTINISLKTILMTIGILIGLFLFTKTIDVFLALFLSVIVMSALNPGVKALEKYKVPRPIGILILYLYVFGILGILFTIVVPPLGKQVSSLINTLEVSNLPFQLDQFRWSLQDIGQLLGQFGSSINSVVSVITTTFSGIFFFFTLLVMSFYLIMDRENFHKKIFFFKHEAKSEKIVQEFFDTVEVQLGGWVRGQLLLMLIIGGVTYIILTILSVPFALPLAVLAGFLEILPNLGPTLAAIPAIIIAFLMLSPLMGVIVAVAYVVIQQLENSVVVPRIMKAAVDIEPLTSIILILIGIRVGGVLGALLSIPLYIVFRSALNIYLRETHRL